jgi:hypothetical protein
VGRYVLVGDSPNNSSVQFCQPRLIDDELSVLSHPIKKFDAVLLLKIEPVTFEGFFPVSINNDPDALHVGQTLTVAGYGGTHTSPYPGEAYEARLQVARVWDTEFVAEAPGMGPCNGAHGNSRCVLLLVLVGVLP